MIRFFLFALVLIGIVTPVLLSQPLLGGKVYDLRLDNAQGEALTVTFVPDVDDDCQFYYFPVRPRLALQTFGDLKDVPMFQFIKYNFDVRNDSLVQGGMIQFGVTLELPQDMLKQAKIELAKRIKRPATLINVGMIPITSAQVTLMVTDNNNPLVAKVLGTGEAVRHPGAVMPFMVMVTPEGSAVYEKLVQGTAGIGIQMIYNYKGMTPQVNCKITGSWDKVYTQYSSSHSLQMAVHAFWFGGSAKVDWYTLRDKLLENTDVNIVWNPRPDESTEEGKNLVKMIEEGILTRITETVFKIEPPKPEEGVKPAVAGSEGGSVFSLNYALSVKEVEKRRQGKIFFSYTGRCWLEAKGDPVGGFVSVANQPENIKKLMFQEVTRDEFFNALKIFCRVAIDPTPFGIREVKYHFQYGKTKVTQAFQAEKTRLIPAQELLGEQMKPIFFATAKSPERVKYHLEITIQRGTKVKTLEYPKQKPIDERLVLPSNGIEDISFTPEKTGIRMVYLNFGSILFQEEAEATVKEQKEAKETVTIDPKKCPKFLNVKLIHGDREFVIKIDAKAKKDYGDEIVWPIADDKKPVRCSIIAKYLKSPYTRDYRRNQENDLSAGKEGLNLVLDEGDFEAVGN